MAAFIEWSDEISVGIEEIDNQHRVLLDLINELHDAIHQHRGNEVIEEVLRRLIEYTRIHFTVEESLMRILGYPAYEEHKHQHERLIEHVIGLQKKVDAGKIGIGFELMHFLKIWLTKHIMESDRKYGEYFLKSGVASKLRKPSWTTRFWKQLTQH